VDGAERLEGISFVDHTADVGIDVQAGSLEELFHRAAVGMLALLRGWDEPAAGAGGSDSGAPETAAPPASGHPGSGAGRSSDPDAPGIAGPTAPAGAEAVRETVAVEGRDRAMVLAGWLKELLFLHETAGEDYVEADFERLDDTGARAAVRVAPAAPAVREIKGVTYHELAVVETGGGWRARVIFDV
jgi:SHS2 domain-containing protein